MQSKPLTLTNSSELPLTFGLKTTMPFTLSQTECFLEPKAALTVDVEFDPGYKNDQMSQVVNSRVLAVYKEHPQKDRYRPDRHHLDFGQLLYNKAEEKEFSIVNTGKVTVLIYFSICCS